MSLAGRGGQSVVGEVGQAGMGASLVQMGGGQERRGGGQDRIGAGLVEIGAGQVGRGQYGEAVDHAEGGLGQFPRERVQFARGDRQQYATGGGGENLELPGSQPLETGTDYKYTISTFCI